MRKISNMTNQDRLQELSQVSGMTKVEIVIGLIAYILGPLDKEGRELFHKGAKAGAILANTPVEIIRDRIQEAGIRPTSRNYELLMGIQL